MILKCLVRVIRRIELVYIGISKIKFEVFIRRLRDGINSQWDFNFEVQGRCLGWKFNFKVYYYIEDI